MSIDINLHNVQSIEVSEPEERQITKEDIGDYSGMKPYKYFTKNLTFVQKDGSETVITLFADSLEQLEIK